MILGFSGSADEVRRKKNRICYFSLMGSVIVGQVAGKAWYARKYDYPYLRDFIMDLGCVVDVAETATTWSNVENLYHQVKKVGDRVALTALEVLLFHRLITPHKPHLGAGSRFSYRLRIVHHSCYFWHTV